MNHVRRISLAVSSALFLAVGGCGLGSLSSSSDTCQDTTHANSCSGTFVCENSGIHFTCDAATQVCVVAPGSVNCVTVASASATHCPSETDAAAQSGCTTPFKPSCSGSSSAGIVVTCAE